MDIVKGKQSGPVRALAYGPEKVGKTTFAAQWPTPLFVDADRGTRRMDVERVCPLSWSAVLATVDELTRDAKGYQTLVLDTCDWLEYLAVEHVLATIPNAKGALVTNIEAYGWGGGYVHLNDAWKKLLDKLALMQDRNGMHVVLLAHASMRKLELPEETGNFDRWELKCMKQCCSTLKEWPEMVLFLNYETIVVTMENGKRKAQGGRRVLHAAHHPCWDAGNRFGLPEKMELPEGRLPKELAELIAGCTKTAPAPAPARATIAMPAPAMADKTPLTEAAAADLAPVPTEQRAAADPEKATLLAQLAQLMTGSSITKEQLGAEMARQGIVPADMSPRDYNLATLKRVVSNWAKVVNNVRLQIQNANKAV